MTTCDCDFCDKWSNGYKRAEKEWRVRAEKAEIRLKFLLCNDYDGGYHGRVEIEPNGTWSFLWCDGDGFYTETEGHKTPEEAIDATMINRKWNI